MRLLVDHFLPRTAGMGSPGIDELRWLAPVRPGDSLSLRITVTEARRSRTKPDRGLVRTAQRGFQSARRAGDDGENHGPDALPELRLRDHGAGARMTAGTP